MHIFGLWSSDMSRVLQPGIKAPLFRLPDAISGHIISLKTYHGQNVVLIFFPSAPDDDLLGQLTSFQNKLSDFEGQGAALIGVCDAAAEALRHLAEEKGIHFPLGCDVDPAQAVSASYGAISPEGNIAPSVLVIDGDGLIRRIYEAAHYPSLPNPMMVLRAIRKLADAPKPTPVTQDDWQLGPLDAPVVLIEYADYECRPCGEAYRLLKQVVPLYDDKILWVHRHLPLRHSHPLAQQAAEAAEAAGAQGKFWEMHDRLFEARGALERDHLIEYAREIGLDVGKFRHDLEQGRFRDAVNEDFKLAVRNKIKLPPVLFINGILVEGSRTQETISAKIEELLAFE
jgi:peroxiredoxin/protein-disulfide isomerase